LGPAPNGPVRVQRHRAGFRSAIVRSVVVFQSLADLLDVFFVQIGLDDLTAQRGYNAIEIIQRCCFTNQDERRRVLVEAFGKFVEGRVIEGGVVNRPGYSGDSFV